MPPVKLHSGAKTKRAMSTTGRNTVAKTRVAALAMNLKSFTARTENSCQDSIRSVHHLARKAQARISFCADRSISMSLSRHSDGTIEAPLCGEPWVGCV